LIIGVGGVGSFAAESLVRSGAGHLSLVDFDDSCVTNANRQLHALQSTIGKKKAEVMAERLSRINPQAEIQAVAQFYNADTSEALLAQKTDLILDCIDNITAKCLLLSMCRERGIPVITSGGAGSRIDPLKITVSDLSDTHTDPFLAQIRKNLHTCHGFPNEGALGIPCVFTTEPPRTPHELEYDKGMGFKCVCPQGQNDFHSCERRNIIHGTASFITGTFGLIMASQAVKRFAQE
jgi:tRNA A37 threonylcarbamoyladenosine dehydratase